VKHAIAILGARDMPMMVKRAVAGTVAMLAPASFEQLHKAMHKAMNTTIALLALAPLSNCAMAIAL